jgi:hypothetical protein
MPRRSCTRGQRAAGWIEDFCLVPGITIMRIFAHPDGQLHPEPVAEPLAAFLVQELTPGAVYTRCWRARARDIVGAAGAKLRDRSRSVKWRLLEIARAARAKGPTNKVASCWMRPAAWLARPGASHERSPKA